MMLSLLERGGRVRAARERRSAGGRERERERARLSVLESWSKEAMSCLFFGSANELDQVVVYERELLV